MEPRPGEGPGDIGRQRSRLGRSILQSQLVAFGAVLLLSWIVILVRPSSLGDPLVYGGLVAILLVTAAALLVTWSERNLHVAVLLPIIDIGAIIAIRDGEPSLGSGLFLVFPVIWLARTYRVAGAIGGVLFSSALLWASWGLRFEEFGIDDFPSLILLPITLVFISTTAYFTAQRTRGQRRLLSEQARLVEAAFSRARTQEALLDEILNAVEFGVIAFDRDGRVTLMNDAHRRSLAEFGAPRSAVIHPVAYQADRTTPYPQQSRPFFRALGGQSFENLTFWIGPPGGRQAAFSVTSRHLTTATGEPDGGVLVLRDVTKELQAIAARDSLIGSVSHELRTPLTSILGYLELALDDPGLPTEAQQQIGVAHRNAERLLVLVTDLLLAASDADQNLPIELQHIDIASIAEQSIEAQRLAAEERGIVISEEIVGTAPANADPLRIRQVMDNLLSNAIKYNRPDGMITVTVEGEPDQVVVRVRDTGLGISSKDREQLFDRFFRTESARASAAVGSGLGLSITRDIARQHGGDLTVESELGVGSVFTLTIPTEPALPTTSDSQSTEVER